MPAPFCPVHGYSHPNCKCYDEIAGVPSLIGGAVAGGGGGGGGGGVENASGMHGGSGLAEAIHQEEREIGNLKKMDYQNSFRAAPLHFAEGGEVSPVPEMPVSPVEQIVSQIPEMTGSYSKAAEALTKPITEEVLGNPEINGEHIVGHMGLRTILDGKLNDSIVRRSERAEDPANAGLMGLGHVEKLISKHSSSLDTDGKNLFDGKEEKPKIEEPNAENHKELIEKIHTLSSDMPSLIDHISNSTIALHAVAPQTAASAQQTMTRAIQFLASKSEQPLKDPLDEELPPSQSEMNSFNRYLHIVENPKVALTQLKNGTLMPETMETLSAVYPKLYDKMKQSVIASIDSSASYQKKLAASQFLGDPLDSSLSPERILSLQTSMIPEKEPEVTKKPKGKSEASLDISSRTSLKPQDE